MRYRYKFKTTEKCKENCKENKSISKKSRMLLLLLWSVIAVGLYLVFSGAFALLTTQIIEIFVLVGLVLYWVFAIRVRKLIRTQGEDSSEIPGLVNKGKLCLLFVVPLVFILIYDFIATSLVSFVL